MKRYKAYKDSGVKWIGEIPSHWDIRTLSQMSKEHYISNKKVHHQNLLSLSYGKIVNKDINTTEGLLPASFDGYQIIEDGNIVLRLTDLQNDHKSLRIGLCTQKGIITSAYLALETFADILPYYLYYLLHSIDVKKVFYSLGNGLRQSLNWAELRKLKCVVPPLHEQQAIASYLKDKTLKIEQYVSARERERELLDSLKQSEIANVVTKGLNPNVKMKDSGIPWIGEIPEHWEVKRWGNAFKENKDINSNLENTIAFQFNYGSLIKKKREYKEEEDSVIYAKYTIIKPKDIVINGLNLNYDFVSQRVAISKEDGIITSAYLTMRPRDNVNAEYFCYLFKTMDAMKLFHGMGTGIRLTLSFAELKKQYIPFPPLSEQQAIVSYIDSKLQKIDQYMCDLQREIDYLKEFKQRLISDAVTGQLCITKQ